MCCLDLLSTNCCVPHSIDLLTIAASERQKLFLSQQDCVILQLTYLFLITHLFWIQWTQSCSHWNQLEFLPLTSIGPESVQWAKLISETENYPVFRQETTRSANSKVCLHSREEYHFCRLRCVTPADLLTPLCYRKQFMPSWKRVLLAIYYDQHHWGAEKYFLTVGKHQRERESNSISKFRSPSLNLPPGPLDHRSWTRPNRLLSDSSRVTTAMQWIGQVSSLHCDCGAVLPTITHVVEECQVGTAGGWFTMPSLPWCRSVSWVWNLDTELRCLHTRRSLRLWRSYSMDEFGLMTRGVGLHQDTLSLWIWEKFETGSWFRSELHGSIPSLTITCQNDTVDKMENNTFHLLHIWIL